MFGLIYFAIFAATLGCGAGLLLSRRADHAAFWLMGAMVGIAANFLLLSQEFLAFAQIIVYVGAVMVLFLFVIMLLNLREPEPPLRESLTARRLVSYAMVALTVVMILVGFLTDGAEPFLREAALVESPKAFSAEAVKALVVDLLTTWIYPFELVSLLLLAAVVGAIIIARRRPILMIDAAKGAPAISSSGRVVRASSSAPKPSSASPSGRLVKKT